MSKTVTREFTVYSFSELSEEAKERVRQDYLESNRWPEDFQEMMKSDLDTLFPNSDLKVSFDSSCSQDEHMNIYGDLSLTDTLNFLSDILYTDEFSNFTEKEIRFLKWAVSEYPQTVKLRDGMQYSRPGVYGTKYGIARGSDLIEDLEYDLEYDNIRDIRYNTLGKMEKVMKKVFKKICMQWALNAEEYFYSVDDSEVEEWAEDNDYYFTENGGIFD